MKPTTSKSTWIGCILIIAATNISAATFTVTTTNDSGPGSFRAAVEFANNSSADDQIVFNIGDCPGGVCRIVLTSGELVISAVSGSGALKIKNIQPTSSMTISANNSSRAFNVSAGADLTLEGLTLENGQAGVGGAIASRGSLFVSRCLIRNNKAIGNQPSLGSGGAVWSMGSLSVHASEISSNASTGIGGGIFTFGSLVILDSTIAENTAMYDGGGLNILISPPSSAVIANSTISRNKVIPATALLYPSSGGGAFVSSASDSRPVHFINVTITDNEAPHAGGLGNSSSGAWDWGSVAIKNSLIVGNRASNYADLDGAMLVENLGNNIIGGSVPLGPLRNNGGPTRTHALLPGSPAIDAGDNCVLVVNGCGYGNPGLPFDQRAFSREGSVDIGAIERLQGDSNRFISGRVLTSAGIPIRGASVVLTDENGNTTTVVTSSLGYFSFEDLSPNTSTVTVRSKRYRFAPQSVEPSASLRLLEFVGVE